MNDRNAFHRAILGQPADDTPRLVFADWLDEHAASDQDRARAEFIRLACKQKKRLDKDTAAWLEQNWKRLVPTLVGAAALRTDKVPVPLGCYRNGRMIHLTLTYRIDDAGNHQGTVLLEFWRGFVERFMISGARTFFAFAGLIRQDDPVARPEWLSTPSGPIEIDGRHGVRVNYWTFGPLWTYLTGADMLGPEDMSKAYFPPWPFHGDTELAYTMAEARLQNDLALASLKWMNDHAGVGLYQATTREYLAYTGVDKPDVGSYAPRPPNHGEEG
jgi:uncharacterized protein (TIGR02996 family)